MSVMLKIIEKITVFLKPVFNCRAVAAGKAIIELKTSIPTILSETEIAAAAKIENK